MSSSPWEKLKNKSEENLKAANFLSSINTRNAAASRYYYAAYQIVKSYVLKHEGERRLTHEDAGKIAQGLSWKKGCVYNNLKDARETADYGPESINDLSDIENWCRDIKTFMEGQL